MTNLFVDTQSEITIKKSDFQPLPELVCHGVKVVSDDLLYSSMRQIAENTRLTFIPYHAFANRGEHNMQVWVNELRNV